MTERIVVVGFGPVAARLVDELLPAVRSGLVHLTVVGEESEAAYNRVLVADLGVGRTTASALALADAAALVADGVDVRLGVRVRRVDRARQQVILSDGTSPGYDRLVFATGSRPVIPNLTGLNPDPAAPVLPAGVTALRDLRDAAVLREAVAGGKRVVVLGGGVLGLETALAAAEEGATVTVVHNGPHPLGRNIDRGGGAVLAARCGTAACGWPATPAPPAWNTTRPTAASPPCCSMTAPRSTATCWCSPAASGRGPNSPRAAGSRPAAGILVDHKLRAHHEPHIFAIGDCAEVRCPDPECVECRTARGPSGLVGPGWRQAEWLAEYLTAAGVRRRGRRPRRCRRLPAEQPGVIVLKARGMNMAVAGDNAAEPWDEEALTAGAVNGRARLQVAQWADPEHGRYVKMTTRAGVLEGLVAVGMPRTSAELVQLFERGAELPADRSLLLRLDGPDQAAAAGAADPERTVCRCAGVSGTAIAAAAPVACGTVAEVSGATRAGTGCGGCHDDIKGIIEKHFQVAVA